MKKLTASQVASYRKNGYLFVPKLFPPKEIRAIDREVAQFMREQGYDLREYAERLGVTGRSVRNYIVRALLCCREAL